MGTSNRLDLTPLRRSFRRAWVGLKRRWAAALPAGRAAPPRRFSELQRLEGRHLLSASPFLLFRNLAGGFDGNAPSTSALLANNGRHGHTFRHENLSAANGPAAAGKAVRRELVIIDPRVADYQQLVAGLVHGGPGRSVQVVVLDGTRDGIDQVSRVLARYHGLDAVHIVSHGLPGEVQLGNTWLDTGDLSRYSAEIHGWSRALNKDADLLFYGCDVAETGQGQALLRRVGRLTGADVAGSTDRTGGAAEGGNWALEYQTGPIHTALPFTEAALGQWQGVLATFTVTNVNDSGAGSLRQAIVNANLAPGANTIAFNIPGTGVQNISVNSALPAITGFVTIDGYTQPGTRPNTLAAGDNAVVRVELNGAPAGAGVDGLSITGINCVVKGLVINRFSGNGINLGGINNLVEGCFIGTDPTGATALGNANDGVLSTGLNNTVGGTAAAAGNVISANYGNGVAIGSGGALSNVIEGNFIGTDVSGTVALGNALNGVSIDYTAPLTTVGGTAAGAGNLIADNGGDGVVIYPAGSQNAVLGNSIYANGKLGIDLGNDGVTANTGSEDLALANDGMNFPVLTSAVETGSSLTVTGYVGTAPGQVAFAGARVEIFKADNDPSGYGQGETYLGSLTANLSGDFSGRFTVAGLSPGDTLTATATDSLNNTSEFAADVVVNPSKTTVASSANSSVYGQTVTFTAIVSAAAPPGTPSGTVTFLDGGTALGTVGLSGGTASLATSALAAGSHRLTVRYSGDSVYAASTSAVLTQTVTPAPVTVTAADATKVYGQANPPFSAGYSGLVNGDTAASLSGAPSLSTTATAGSHVGSYTIAVGPGTLSDPNYTFAFVSGTLTVTPAPLTVTANNAGKVYGQANPAFTASYSGFVNGDTAAVVNGSASLTTTATAASHVGAYAITAGPGSLSAADYAFTFVNGTLTVTPAPLTVTADNATKVYGQADPTFTASYSGFVNGDTAGSLTGTLAFATPATASSPAGSYAVAPAGLTSGDYAISFVSGTLTVTPAGGGSTGPVGTPTTAPVVPVVQPVVPTAPPTSPGNLGPPVLAPTPPPPPMVSLIPAGAFAGDKTGPGPTAVARPGAGADLTARTPGAPVALVVSQPAPQTVVGAEAAQTSGGGSGSAPSGTPVTPPLFSPLIQQTLLFVSPRGAVVGGAEGDGPPGAGTTSDPTLIPGAAPPETSAALPSAGRPDLLPQIPWPGPAPAAQDADLFGLPPQAAALVGTGVLASTGYLLLNTRTGVWLLSLLAAQPLWKELDPLEVLYAWEREKERDGEEGETLLSLVE